MSLIDLLRMSSGNLKRRKLRTFLTVLGVIIGTASIVVMISLGLGLQKSIYAEVEQMGGITNIQVFGLNGSDMLGHFSDTGEVDQYITDKTIAEFEMMEHVINVNPVVTIPTIISKGKYMASMELYGVPQSQFRESAISLEDGSSFPAGDTPGLELLFGNWMPEYFYDANTGRGYWETGELPDIRYDSDQFQVLLDAESYWTQSESNPFEGEGTSGTVNRAAKRHIAQGVGLIAGGQDQYSEHAWRIYCDIDVLMGLLKKEFAGRAIPGQPLQENGKPYKDFMYSYADVKVDDISNVKQLSQQFRDMGYATQSNLEYLDSMESQFAIIQMVLGGIGAISLLVAAIGIANTMMMSIYERTKEIGVLKVLGCDMKNIKQLFLLEAAGIGLLGGIAGNLLSFLLSKLINVIVMSTSQEFSQGISYVPWWLFIIAMGVAMSVGMLAGYFPARRAMQLSALEAIRTN